MTDPLPETEMRARQGDANALAEFLEANRRPLRVYVDRQMSHALRQKVDADDLVQEVMVSCLQAQAEVDLSTRDLFGWMCQMAQRRIIDAGRKFTGAQKRDAKREISLNAGGRAAGDDHQGLVDLLVASITSPSRVFSRNQKEMRLLSALDELPPDQRDALRMRYVEGLPTKEIAERMGKTDGSIRVMLTRSLKKLGEIMQEFDEFTRRQDGSADSH